MSGLSRRHFLQTSAALAAGLGLAYGRVGSALAAPLAPARDAPSTLLSTIRQLNVGNLQYRTLVANPGEPYLPRLDVLGKSPSENRTKNRRSLYYLGHLSDVHIIDAQSPARLEPLLAVSVGTFSGSARPQDTLTVNVLTETVNAMNALRVSPVTGAPVAAFLNTGDNADMHSQLELKWYIETLDGASITPNSGAPDVYDGMQAWLDTQMIYHPEQPEGDEYGAYGFPARSQRTRVARSWIERRSCRLTWIRPRTLDLLGTASPNRTSTPVKHGGPRPLARGCDCSGSTPATPRSVLTAPSR